MKANQESSDPSNTEFQEYMGSYSEFPVQTKHSINSMLRKCFLPTTAKSEILAKQGFLRKSLLRSQHVGIHKMSCHFIFVYCSKCPTTKGSPTLMKSCHICFSPPAQHDGRLQTLRLSKTSEIPQNYSLKKHSNRKGKE